MTEQRLQELQAMLDEPYNEDESELLAAVPELLQEVRRLQQALEDQRCEYVDYRNWVSHD